MFYYYYVKLQLFLLKRRSVFTVVLFSAFYCFFVNSVNDIALCVDFEPDPCEQAYKLSLQDAQQQKASDNWGKRVINGVILDGKTGKLGTGTVEKDGIVYVNQLFEFTEDKTNITLLRVAECVSAAKRK